MTDVARDTVDQGTWQLLTTLSSARFSVRNLGLKRVLGQVPIRSASVEVDEHGRPHAVDAVLELDRIDTGNARRDTDLRRPKLLDTERYPLLQFSGEVADDAADGVDITGVVETKGRRVNVMLHTQVVSRSPAGEVSVHAVTEFDRRELGVTAPRVLIGRRIRVELDAVLVRR